MTDPAFLWYPSDIGTWDEAEVYDPKLDAWEVRLR